MTGVNIGLMKLISYDTRLNHGATITLAFTKTATTKNGAIANMLLNIMIVTVTVDLELPSKFLSKMITLGGHAIFRLF